MQTFVVDECDRMLNLGFAPEMFEIREFLPHPNKCVNKKMAGKLMFQEYKSIGVHALGKNTSDDVFCHFVAKCKRLYKEIYIETFVGRYEYQDGDCRKG